MDKSMMNDWTVYNNTKKWQDLTDEQSGALLLRHYKWLEQMQIQSKSSGNWFDVDRPQWTDIAVYRVVGPELEMWEVMRDDIHLSGTLNANSIAWALVQLGWTKV
jgi:hypothetical protein